MAIAYGSLSFGLVETRKSQSVISENGRRHLVISAFRQCRIAQYSMARALGS